MEQNVGKADKITRAVVAVIFLILGYRLHWAFYALAGVMILVAFTGFCPIYSLFKMNTNKK